MRKLKGKITKDIKGSLTIEATLVIPVFMFAFLFLISFANQARTESIVQHVISQVAKELSTYLYLADKSKLISSESATSPDVSLQLGQNIHSLSKIPRFEESPTNANSSYKNIESMTKTPNQLLNDLVVRCSNGINQKLLIETFVWPSALSKFEENLKVSESNLNIEDYIKSLQIEGGKSGLDFSDSRLLLDGRTIQINVAYRIKSIFPIIYKKNKTIRQTASTTAWVKSSLIENENKLSKWKLGSLERGRAWLDVIRKENREISVAPGIGVDLYEAGTCTFVYSINLFSSSYCLGNLLDGTFELKRQILKEQLNAYVTKSIEQTSKLSDQIEMQNGKVMNILNDEKKISIQMIVPEESIRISDLLNQLASEIKNEKGVSLEWIYREKAL